MKTLKAITHIAIVHKEEVDLDNYREKYDLNMTGLLFAEMVLKDSIDVDEHTLVGRRLITGLKGHVAVILISVEKPEVELVLDYIGENLS